MHDSKLLLHFISFSDLMHQSNSYRNLVCDRFFFKYLLLSPLLLLLSSCHPLPSLSLSLSLSLPTFMPLSVQAQWPQPAGTQACQ